MRQSSSQRLSDIGGESKTQNSHKLHLEVPTRNLGQTISLSFQCNIPPQVRQTLDRHNASVRTVGTQKSQNRTSERVWQSWVWGFCLHCLSRCPSRTSGQKCLRGQVKLGFVRSFSTRHLLETFQARTWPQHNVRATERTSRMYVALGKEPTPRASFFSCLRPVSLSVLGFHTRPNALQHTSTEKS